MRPHSKLSPFHHLSTLDVTHVKKDTRPSVFFMQLKTAQAWEQGYCQARVATCIVEQWAALRLCSTLRLTLDSQAHQGQDSLHCPFWDAWHTHLQVYAKETKQTICIHIKKQCFTAMLSTMHTEGDTHLIMTARHTPPPCVGIQQNYEHGNIQNGYKFSTL